MKIQQMLSNGRWYREFVSDEQAQMLIDLAVKMDIVTAGNLKRKPKTREEIVAELAAGKEICFCSDWYGMIRDGEIAAGRGARKTQPVDQIRCDCGHMSAHPMTTARGTACPNCYDRMSN